MSILKLNSIANDVFDRIECEDRKINTAKCSISRNDIVATGRLIACEYAGNQLKGRPDIGGKFNSRCEAKGLDYNAVARDHQREKFLFCAAIANQAVGKEAPADFEEAKNSNYMRNETFWAAYNAIDVDVLSPLLPSVFEDVASGGLMQIVEVPLGQTYQLDVQSNDVFLFEDNAWGSGRSTSKNYLYGKTVTLTPKMFSCNATIKWYQDVVNGDAGRYYAAIMGGMWNKMYAMFMQTLISASANEKYIPSKLKATTYTSDNWTNITTLVAAANNVSRSDLFAFGTPLALSKVLPADGNGSGIAGLMYGLGEQWFTRGFLPKAGAVDLVEVNPVIVPGTQNHTLDTISLGNDIFIAAKGGFGYAPLYAAIGQGSPITLVSTPSETSDFTIDINCGAYFDVKPVFGTKVGVITTVA